MILAFTRLMALTIVLVAFSGSQIKKEETAKTDPGAYFLDLILGDEQEQKLAWTWLASNWDHSYSIMALETIRVNDRKTNRDRLLKLLESKTGQQFLGYNDWFRWVWAQDFPLPPHYAEFKSELYRLLDRRFENYFEEDRASTIRLDEIRWGGVIQDGIPPLRNPQLNQIAEANWLADDHVVFGVSINGVARAYPKRILGWHELVTDTVGGEAITGVFCTLCGSMIVYRSNVDGEHHQLGTSGFLFRSNKLMYDEATQSLWNTLWGEPVVGPLVGKGIRLETLSVVTTTWGEWKARHPKSSVVSLNTGFDRDYSEGEAYREYFASDEVMFAVPHQDSTLYNKDEVFCLYLPEQDPQAVAISTKFLLRQKRYTLQIGALEVLVLTDRSGASRAYATNGQKFRKWDRDHTIVDSKQRTWTLKEDQLETADGEVLKRIPAHRAFWFGWKAAFPNTRVIL